MVNVISYYVYEHRRKDTGDVFYIGKGTRSKKKAYGRSISIENRNIIWRRIVKKANGFDAIVLAEFILEDYAFEYEKELIKHYGKLVDGGTLCNLTDGGEGCTGRIISEETRKKKSELWKGEKGVWFGKVGPNKGKKFSQEVRDKISKAMKGKFSGEKHPLYGIKHTDEWRLNHSKKISGGNHPLAKPIIDDKTGIVYECTTYAAKAFGVSKSTVQMWLKGKRRNPTSLRYI